MDSLHSNLPRAGANSPRPDPGSIYDLPQSSSGAKLPGQPLGRPTYVPPQSNPKFFDLPAQTQELLDSLHTLKIPAHELAALEVAGRQKIERIAADFSCLSVAEYCAMEAGTRMGSSKRSVVGYPDVTEQAANFSYARLKDSGVCLHINGMAITGHAAITGYTESLLKFYGKPVFVVVNPQQTLDGSDRAPSVAENILGSVWNATVSLLKAEWGHNKHPGVRQAVEMIKRLMAEDIPVHMVVHSQGSIVGSNALMILKNESSPAEWQKISEMVRVEAVGAVQLRFPDGPEVRTRVYKDDPLYYLGQAISDAKGKIFKEDLSLPSRGSLTELDGFSHDFDVCASTLHQFIIRESLGRDRSVEAGKRLAWTFIDGVARAAHADSVFLKLVDAVVVLDFHSEYSHVVRGFKEELRELFPTGRIGRLALTSHQCSFLGVSPDL